MSENLTVNLKNFTNSRDMDAKVQQQKRSTTRLNRNQMVTCRIPDTEGNNSIRSVSRRLMRLQTQLII